jgi:hypothetical protein
MSDAYRAPALLLHGRLTALCMALSWEDYYSVYLKKKQINQQKIKNNKNESAKNNP